MISIRRLLVQGNINYELADHCVTLTKSGVLCQVESLHSTNYNSQLSTATQDKLKYLPRSPSEDIFDRVKELLIVWFISTSFLI